jgi:hypothetical protein
LRPDQSFQIAMVTIEDRSVLSEGARRTRGIQPQAPSPSSGEKPAERRYRDIDIPTALLRNAITSTSTHKENAERSELINYLRAQNDVFDNQARILIDSALAESLSKKPDERNSIQVRVYDLDDSRAANIRSKLQLLQADAHFILLTLKP